MLVSEAIDRALSQNLQSDENMHAFDILAADITASATTMTVSGLKQYAPQTVIEVDSELIFTKEPESSTAIDLNERGFRESSPAAHTAGAKVWINPDFTRVSLLNVAAQIVSSLYGMGLYRILQSTSLTPSVTSPVALPTGAKEVLEVLVRSGSLHYERLRRGKDYEVFTAFDPPQLQMATGVGMAMTVNYKADFTTPTSESQDLGTYCGVPTSLEPHFPKAIAAVALEGKGVPRVMIEDIKSRLAAEGEQVGAALSVSQTLMQAFERQVLMERNRLMERTPLRLTYVR